MMLIFLLIVLQVLDYILTYEILDEGGAEFNKFTLYFLQKLGNVLGLIVVKGFTILLLLFALTLDLESISWWPYIGLTLVFYYVAIIIWNSIQLKRLRNG